MVEEYTPPIDYPDYMQEFAISAVLVDSIPIKIVAQTIDVIRIDIVAQSIGNIAVDIAAQSVGNLAVDIAAQTISTLKIDIAAQSLGQVNVNIAASAITLNVAIQSSAVTLDVNIAAQAVDINIKTSGGANIVIDKLMQWAVGPRDRWETNYADSPERYVQLNYPRGVIFPRGMRGVIGRVRVWMQNTSGGDLTLNWSLRPAVGMGPIISGSTTIPNGTDGWVDLIDRYTQDVKSFYWAYDQLVVQLEAEGNLSVGNNSGCFVSYVFFNNAYYLEAHLMIAVSIEASSVGDLPVTGTVNVIAIPHSSSQGSGTSISVPAGTETVLRNVEGAGYCDFIDFQVAAATASHSTVLRVYCDGVLAFELSPEDLSAWGAGASTPKVSLLSYASGGYCNMLVTQRFEFRRQLSIRAYNASADQVVGYLVVWSLIR